MKPHQWTAATRGGSQLNQMLSCALVLLLGAAAAGTSIPSTASDGPAPVASHPAPAERNDTPDGRPLDGPSAKDSKVNPNNIFVIPCARGLVPVGGQCLHSAMVRTRPPLSLPPIDGQQDYDAADDDDFLASLGVGLDLLPPADAGSNAPTAMTPAVPTIGPVSDTATPSVSEFIGSLSDEEFLTELLRGDGEEETSPGPSKSPVPAPMCTSCRHGVILISVGSVFLVLALLLAIWAGLRWRSHKATSAETV